MRALSRKYERPRVLRVRSRTLTLIVALAGKNHRWVRKGTREAEPAGGRTVDRRERSVESKNRGPDATRRARADEVKWGREGDEERKRIRCRGAIPKCISRGERASSARLFF